MSPHQVLQVLRTTFKIRKTMFSRPQLSLVHQKLVQVDQTYVKEPLRKIQITKSYLLRSPIAFDVLNSGQGWTNKLIFSTTKSYQAALFKDHKEMAQFSSGELMIDRLIRFGR